MKPLLNFLSQHYERVIAVLVMLAFAIFSVLLLIKVNELQTQIQQDIPARAEDVKPVDLKELQNAYTRLSNPPAWADSEHALFKGPPMKELKPGILTEYKGTNDLRTPEGFTFEWLHRYRLPTKRYDIGGLDPDDDKFTIYEEFLAGTDPTNEFSRPDLALKLRLDTKMIGGNEYYVIKKAFPFKFNGALGDGNDRTFSIQRAEAGGNTWYLKLNDTIPDKQYPGYKIVEYNELITNRVDKTINPPILIKTDVSRVFLQRGTEPRIFLTKGQPRSSEELYVKFYYIIDNRNLVEMCKNEKFELEKGYNYEVDEIISAPNPEDIRVKIHRLQTGQEFIIKPITKDERAKFQAVAPSGPE